MCTRENISAEQAEKLIIKTDQRRAKFVDNYLTKSQSKFVYDISFNCAKFTQEEIIDVILKIAEIKSLIK
jgi:cytidylate kinase